MTNNLNSADNQNGSGSNSPNSPNSPTSPRNNSPGRNQLDAVSPNADNLIKSKTHVVKNNYWNDRHENILKGLQLNSGKLYKEYQKAHLIYKKKLRLYRIPIIVMSSLSGFLSISNSGYVPASYNKWVSMLVGFVNLMVTVISLIENFKKIDVNMNKTYTAYLDFKKLHDEISMILNTPQNERDDNGYDMSNTFFSRYEMYLNDAPILGKNLHDYLDSNSPDNTTQSINTSSSYSRSPDGSGLSEAEDEEMNTELDGNYDDEIDDLESQKKKLQLAKLKSKRALQRSASSVLRNSTESKTQSSVLGNVLGLFGFGASNDLEPKSDAYRDNLNNLKATVKNSGRERAQSSSDEFNKNVFLKRQELQKKAREEVKKTKALKEKAKQAKSNIENIVESTIGNNIKAVEKEANSNLGRLEEEMRKIDDLELKPSKLPKLRNIKISEDIDSGSKKDEVDSDSESSLSDDEN